MKQHAAVLAFLAAVAASAAHGQSVTLLHSAVGTSVPADASLDMVINAGLSTDAITVYDIIASYTATPTFRFIGTAFMLPGTPAAGGSGGYVGPNSIGSLDGNYGCQLEYGSFTDTGVTTYNLGNADDTTWLSNFDGAPAGTVVPTSFVSTPTQIAQRIGNTVVEPAGPVVNRIYARIRVNAGLGGVISADFRLSPGQVTRIGKQWRITSIPEPPMLALLGAGGVAVALRSRWLWTRVGARA